MFYVKLFFVLLVSVAVTECVRVHLPGEEWTNSWAVGVSEDMTERDVNRLAERYGFQNKRQVGNLPGVYNFVLKGGDFRERAEKTLQLLSSRKVKFAIQEKTKPMVPKKFQHNKFRF